MSGASFIIKGIKRHEPRELTPPKPADVPISKRRAPEQVVEDLLIENQDVTNWRQRLHVIMLEEEDALRAVLKRLRDAEGLVPILRRAIATIAEERQQYFVSVLELENRVAQLQEIATQKEGKS